MFAEIMTTALALHPIAPLHTYNSVNNGITIEVDLGSDIDTGYLVLLDYDNNQLSPPVEITGGRCNLVEEIPAIKELTKTALVQLYIFDAAVNSPLVVQPLTTREVPVVKETMRSDGKTTYLKIVDWVNEAEEDDIDSPFVSGWRVYINKDAVIETSEGDIRISFRPDAAPNTVWNFRELIEGGLYQQTIFHRIVPELGDGFPFVIQGGDPTGTGYGGPGYWLPIENSHLPHDFGVISMARAGNPDSAGSQFFLCLSREGTARLDGQYCSFGETVDGGDVIRKIANTPIENPETGKPSIPPTINSIRLVPAPFRQIK